MLYWSKLNNPEKESLLNVAKQFVQLKNYSPDDLRKQIVMEERVNHLNKVEKSFTWDEIKEMPLIRKKLYS